MHITLECPNDLCDIEVWVEVEPADPSVGYMTKGYIPCIPDACDTCGHVFTSKEHDRLFQSAVDKAYDY